MRHILSFVIFVELLIVEVNHLEIVIGRLTTGGFPAQPWRLGASAINIKRLLHCILLIYFCGLLASLARQILSFYIKSRADLVGGSVFSDICEWVELCNLTTKSDLLAKWVDQLGQSLGVHT